MILALDLALTTGFAYGAVGTPVPEHGSHKLCAIGEQLGVRFRALRSWLVKMLAERPSTSIVIFEAPLLMHSRPDQLHVVRALHGYAAIVEELLEGWPGITVYEATVADIRRHFIGRTNLKSADAKRAVMERCRQIGWQPVDNNAGDALAAWSYQCSLIKHDLAMRATPLFGRRA